MRLLTPPHMDAHGHSKCVPEIAGTSITEANSPGLLDCLPSASPMTSCSSRAARNIRPFGTNHAFHFRAVWFGGPLAPIFGVTVPPRRRSVRLTTSKKVSLRPRRTR